MMWPRLTPIRNVRPFEARDFRRLTIKGRLETGVTMAAGADGADGHRARTSNAPTRTRNRNRRIVVRTELQNRIAQSPPDRHAAGDADAARGGGAVRRVRQRRRPADEPGAGAGARDRAAAGHRRGTSPRSSGS